jgi:hypothetical protein
VGALLHNARAVDPTLIVPLSALDSYLSTATATTISAVSHLLEYCSNHPESSIRYFASHMQLNIHSDASYLSEPKAKSRIGGYFYLGNKKNTRRNPYPMVHFCDIQQYSNMWSHMLLRPNLVQFLSMQKKALSRAQHWMKWVTTRTLQNSKLTTPHQMELSITQSNKNNPNQWTRDSTGSKTEWNKTNSMLVGRQVTPIWEIILLSIILQRITHARYHNIYMIITLQCSDMTQDYQYCEGVLIFLPDPSPTGHHPP